MKPEFERTSFSDLLVWYQVSGVLGALLLSRSGGETQLSLISKPEKPLGSICSFNLGQKHSGHLKLSLFCQKLDLHCQSSSLLHPPDFDMQDD